MDERIGNLFRLRAPLLKRGDALAGGAAEWSFESLAGRLVELRGGGDDGDGDRGGGIRGADAAGGGSAALTAAVGLVRDAQLRRETVAWITPVAESFYPPDAAEGGVDLEALAVVRTPDPGRAATHLLRSGAFGLVVADLGAARLPTAIQARLLGLAQKHRAAILFLTRAGGGAAPLGSLVSLRGVASCRREGFDRFRCEVRIVKDKRRAPGWSHAEVCRGPDGLH